MPKQILHIFLVLVMVFGAVGVASANFNGPNNPANAAFTKIESKNLASVGDTVTFTVTVENPNIDNGHNDFTDVAISDTVPSGLEVIGVVGGSHVGNAVSADIGTLTPGQSMTIKIITKAKTKGKYTNTANLVYTVDQGQNKMCCKEQHTDLGELLSDKTLHYNGHDFNANDHKGEVIGNFKSIEMNDQNNNINNQGHQNDQNNNNNNLGHQNDQYCNHNNYKWVHCDKVTHKNCDKCYKWVSDPVQRTAQASSDPLVIKAIPTVKSQTPSVKEPTVNAQKETVGMQETGAPLVALLLAGLMLFSGMLMPKRK
ncbi:MAG: DUF11 domain-containing protein [Methanobacteriaceae archaeon]